MSANIQQARNRNFTYIKYFVYITCFFFIIGAFGLEHLTAAEIITPTGKPQIVATYGQGRLLNISGQRVLLLSGTPYEMGYQQGKLLQKEVKKLVGIVLMTAKAAQLISGDKNNNGGLEGALKRTRKYIDKRYLEEMRGLSDGSGVSLPEIELANIFPEQFHCSGFALFNKATKGGRLLHGRILDYITEVGLQDYAVVTVYQPKGLNAFVTIGYAGFIGSVTGMNSRQVAIGEMGGRGEGLWDGKPMSFLLRKALEEADTLDEAVAMFRNTPRTCEYYYVISDGKIPDARGLACTPEKCEIIAPGQYHPLLPHPLADTVLMSAGDRYNHLSALVKKEYGKIGVSQALNLMNRPVAMKSCLHRVLFSPKDGKFWVANAVAPAEANFAACYQPYYPYDLNQLLQLLPAKDSPVKK